MEDYDLWLKCADRGLHGVLVPQILARYRRAGDSMLSITDIIRRKPRLCSRAPSVLTGEAAEAKTEARREITSHQLRSYSSLFL